MKVLQNLLKLKSIVTIAMTAVFCYLSIIRVIPVELFIAQFAAVITYYFTKRDKKEE